MSETLYPYYERELVFIRQLAQEFARQFPAAAGRLLLEPNRSVDPHVERMIEAFALLAGRVHHKLDDEFPELTDALLGVLYPHYLAPIPSMSVVQFALNPAQAQLPEGFPIPAHTKLRTRDVIDGLRCEYRTGYPVTLWPVAVAEARLATPPFPPGWKPPPRTAAALRLQIECVSEIPFSALTLSRLRLFLFGDNAVIGGLYELLFNHARQVVFRPLERATSLQPVVCEPREALRPVGFEADEGLLPYGRQSFPGYRLLTEFFAFRAKFLFIDLCGFDKVHDAGFQQKLEAVIFLDRTEPNLEQAVEASTFRLGCAPVVNLFEQTAEPKPVTQTRPEYLVTPDVAFPLGMEVYSVESVTSVDPTKGATTEYQPFYSFRHGGGRDVSRAFWYAERRPATGEGDNGTDVYLHLVDLDFDPKAPAEGGAGGADAVYEPRFAAEIAEGRRRPGLRLGLRRAGRRRALPAVADDDAAAAVAPRRPLEIDIAFIPEPSVADRPGGRSGGAAGGPAFVRLFGPAKRPPAGGGQRTDDRGRAVGVEPAGGAADGGGHVERLRPRPGGDG